MQLFFSAPMSVSAGLSPGIGRLREIQSSRLLKNS